MSPTYEKETLSAQAVVVWAANLSKTILHTFTAPQSLTKSDASPVTVADFAIQSLMISTLRHHFPKDGFIGEEDAGALRQDPELRKKVWHAVSGASHDVRDSTGRLDGLVVEPRDEEEMMDMIDQGGKGEGGRTGRWWVMDPVDGTKTFMKGQQYAVNLALVEGGVEVLGVLGLPNLPPDCGAGGSVLSEEDVDRDGLGVMMSAVKGQGASWWRVQRGCTLEPLYPGPMAGVPAPEDSSEWQLVDCFSSGKQNHAAVAELARRLGVRKPMIDLFSSHVRYTALAVLPQAVNVRFPLSGKNKNMLWDHAGANLILREMGFAVTDLHGREIDFGAGRDLNQNRGFVVAKKNIHSRVLEVIQDLLKEY